MHRGVALHQRDRDIRTVHVFIPVLLRWNLGIWTVVLDEGVKWQAQQHGK